MGITRTGNLAVLTNYREATDIFLSSGQKSRGAMVNAWLTASPEETTQDFVERLLSGDGVKGVGGFTLICGKLRKRSGPRAAGLNGLDGMNGHFKENGSENRREIEPLAIISNRADSAADIPWIGGTKGEVYGLSNTVYNDPVEWPKISLGKRLLLDTVRESSEKTLSEDELLTRLFGILDTNTMPERQEGQSTKEYTDQMRNTVFVPPVGGEDEVNGEVNGNEVKDADPARTSGFGHKAPKGDATSGLYGTQRQTVVLVDWDGNVTWVERALWDEKGEPIERGKADVKFGFKVKGWDNERERDCRGKTNGVDGYPHLVES